MKADKYLLLISTILFSLTAFGQNAPALKVDSDAARERQESTFDEKELFALENAASKKLHDKIYRLTVVDTRYNDGDTIATRTEKTIREVVPPESFREITETTNAKGTERIEQITIGKRTFTKRNDRDWQENSGGGTGYGAGNGSGSGSGEKRIQIENKVERRLKKGEIVGSQTTDLYETVRTVRYQFQSNVYSIIIKKSDWFDRNCLLVKSDDEYENTEMKLISRSVKEYEYDPNIKIEAPIKDAPALVKP